MREGRRKCHEERKEEEGRKRQKKMEGIGGVGRHEEKIKEEEKKNLVYLGLCYFDTIF